MEIILIILSVSVAGWIGQKFLLKRHSKPNKAYHTSEIEKIKINFHTIEKWMIENKGYKNTGIKINFLADKTGLSPRQVSVAINTIAKENFNSYINRIRVNESVKLLENKDYDHYTIEAIASMVGFSNKVSFYKAFTKIMGKSPADYKKTAKTTKTI